MPSFICLNCQKTVPVNYLMGTHHRNHCPFCLWSKHVDENPGDRIAFCGGGMKPLGITTKQVSPNKWGESKMGELMLIHQCTKCGKIAINRLAADDSTEEIMKVFTISLALSKEIKKQLDSQDIKLLADKALVTTQLYGKTKG